MKKIWTAIAGGPRTWSSSAFFIIDVVVLAALLLLGPFHPSAVQTKGWLTNPYPGVLPNIVPWAGALGGVCISMVGIATHQRDGDWESEFGYWHLTRSVLGAVFGSVAVLIVSLLLHNVKEATATGKPFTTSGQVVLAVIAFVVGFRERAFRTLIKRVVDLILSPGDDTSNPRRLGNRTAKKAAAKKAAKTAVTKKAVAPPG
jgi:hypothetical protein